MVAPDPTSIPSSKDAQTDSNLLTEADESSSKIRPTIQTLDSLKPTFTTDDVVQHFKKFPLQSKFARDGQPQTLESVKLMTSKEAGRSLGNLSIGLPDAAPVYLVKIRGAFAVANRRGDSSTSTFAHAVFDAHTGDLLVVGTGSLYDK